MPLFIPGTATAADVAAGKTFSARELYNAAGAMPGFSEGGLVIDGRYPSSAHDGYVDYFPGVNGQITDSDLLVINDPNFTQANVRHSAVVHGLAGTFTADATATAADIATGKIAYGQGASIIGTKAGATVTGSVSSQSKTPSVNTGLQLQFDFTVSLPTGKTLLAVSVAPTVRTDIYITHTNTSSVETRIFANACGMARGVWTAVSSTIGVPGNIIANLPSTSYDAGTGLLSVSYRITVTSGTLAMVGGGTIFFTINYCYLTP
jgi:hypothetical protein